MWFLGVLERLLRPLMRTLSLQNDTSQGDGGPPLSSHSPSSVVDASNVASNTMIPPSPTCNRNKEEKKKKKTKIMELLSTEFSSNYFIRPRNIFTSAARRKYPFSLRERKKKISTTRIARVQNLGYYTQRGQSGFLLCTSIRAHVFSASVAICKANQTCPNDTDLSQVFSRNKGLAKKRISAREERVFETKAKRKV